MPGPNPDLAFPLPALVALLANLRKGTVQDELDQFVEVLTGGLAMHALSASAFCQARQQLQPRAVMRLSDHPVATFQARFAWRRWHGRRLLAVDGSTVRLPPSPDVVAAFGPPPEGSRIPLGRVSVLYDVLNAVVVEAELVATDVGERVLAGEHLAATGADDLVLYDRGYPAFWLFALHALEQRDFCMRVPVGFSKEVEAFVASGAPTATVLFTPGQEARRQCEVYRLPSAPLRVRLIRVTLEGGETEVLATSLLDEAAFPTHFFKELYHLHWGVEEQDKRAKCRAEIENFSGGSSHKPSPPQPRPSPSLNEASHRRAERQRLAYPCPEVKGCPRCCGLPLGHDLGAAGPTLLSLSDGWMTHPTMRRTSHRQ